MASKVKDKVPTKVTERNTLGSGYIAGTNLPSIQKRAQKNSEFALLERRKYIATEYLKGRPQWEIARDLGVEQRVIIADLEIIKKQWIETMLTSFDEVKAKQLAKIDWMELELTEAWMKSKEDKVVRSREKFVGFEGGSTFKNKVQKETSYGDTRYMSQLQWCYEFRCKILGVLKDERHQTINNINVDIAWDSIPSTGADAIEDTIRLLEVAPPAEVLPKPVEPGSETI